MLIVVPEQRLSRTGRLAPLAPQKGEPGNIIYHFQKGVKPKNPMKSINGFFGLRKKGQIIFLRPPCKRGKGGKENRPPCRVSPSSALLHFVVETLARLHRNYHRTFLAVLEPKPDFRLMPDSLHPVTAKSKRWEHLLLFRRAEQFRREFHYDFNQWEHPDDRKDPKGRGFLFIDGTGAVVGACAFRWRNWADAPPGWAMQWMWLCPRARRTGILTKYWPVFREMFGDFLPEPPFSPAMEAFFAKQMENGDGLMKALWRKHESQSDPTELPSVNIFPQDGQPNSNILERLAEAFKADRTDAAASAVRNRA